MKAKCNLWLVSPDVREVENQVFWERIGVVIFFVNLSDPQVLKHLASYQQRIVSLSAKEIIVVASYNQDSSLVQNQKVKVLECASRVDVKARNSLSYSIIWDGTDDNERSVSSGTYQPPSININQNHAM